MAVRFSTGLRDKMLDPTTGASLGEAMNDGILRIYTGAQPATADAAATGTLLLEVTQDSGAWTGGSPTNGLGFDAPVSGVLSKAAAETWSGNGVAAGTAGWARLYANPVDAGGSSTTLARIDMSVAVTGGDLNLSNTVIAVSAPHTIDAFQITFPFE